LGVWKLGRLVGVLGNCGVTVGVGVTRGGGAMNWAKPAPGANAKPIAVSTTSGRILDRLCIHPPRTTLS
jgi:hypothetical protein